MSKENETFNSVRNKGRKCHSISITKLLWPNPTHPDYSCWHFTNRLQALGIFVMLQTCSWWFCLILYRWCLCIGRLFCLRFFIMAKKYKIGLHCVQKLNRMWDQHVDRNHFRLFKSRMGAIKLWGAYFEIEITAKRWQIEQNFFTERYWEVTYGLSNVHYPLYPYCVVHRVMANVFQRSVDSDYVCRLENLVSTEWWPYSHCPTICGLLLSFHCNVCLLV